MSSANYSAFVRVIFEAPDTQAQINKLVKNAKVTMKVDLDAQVFSNQIEKFRIKLEKLRISNPKAFMLPGIDQAGKELSNLINKCEAGIVPIEAVKTKFDTLTNGVNRAKLSFKDAGKNAYDFGSMVTTAIKKVAIWLIATEAIYGTMRKIGESIQYIKDLNKEMIAIQVVNRVSNEEITQLATGYNKLAREMGVTTLEIAKGALQWIRAGKSKEDTETLLRASIMMGTLANIEQAQSTEYMTAVLNGFKLEAKDAIQVVDKLVALDNAYATSISEIISGMQLSSAVAKETGVSFDSLAAYITVLSHVTQLSGDTIGQALKTMMVRMQTIKAGKYFEDETQSISDVETALKRVANINIRDAADSFRPLQDVIDELGKKWSTITSETDRSVIAMAIAGLRQKNFFLTLMDNYSMVGDAIKIETESMGTSAKGYEIKLNGIEAAMNESKAAWEGLWQSILDSGAIKWFYNLSAAVADALGQLAAWQKANREFIASLFNKPGTSSLPKQKSWVDSQGGGYKNRLGYYTDIESDYGTLAPPNSSVATGWQDVQEAIDAAAEALKNVITVADKSSDSFLNANNILEFIISDYDQYGQITIDQAYKMIDAGYAAALGINAETGAITINKQALRELVILKAQDAEATAWAAYHEQDAANKRMGIVIPSILAETAALLAKANALHGITTLLQKTPNAVTIPSFVPPTVPSGGGGGSSENKAEQEYQKLLDETIKKIKDKKNAQKDALKAELDAYKKIIDAAKDLLDQKKDERDYTKDVEEQSKTIADIQEELLELQFDNSAEANAKRLDLQAQLVEAQGELEDTQYDRSIEVQKEALDKEYEAYKSGIDARINELELYLADTERITQDALKQIGKAGQDMVSAMGGAIASGISQVNAYAQTIASTLTNAWGQATSAMGDYYAAFYSHGDGYSGGSHGQVFPPYHDGGIVSYDNGGNVGSFSSAQSGEVFAKLMSGEFVATDDMMKNFLNRTLPKISSTSSNNGNITISMPISIAGNLDRSVLPDMEKMVLKTVNNAIKKRGVVRNANSFSV